MLAFLSVCSVSICQGCNEEDVRQGNTNIIDTIIIIMTTPIVFQRGRCFASYLHHITTKTQEGAESYHTQFYYED